MSVRVAVIPPRKADGLVAEVYAEIRHDFGAVVEPFTLHSPAPDLLAAVWRVFRESLIAGEASRYLKEAVATAVSETNRCPWCVDAHTAMLHAANRHDVAGAMRRGREPRDPEAAALVAWADASRSPGAPELASPPFDAAAAPEFIGTAVSFHYINRTVSALLGPSPLPFGGRFGRATSRVAGRWFARAVNRPTISESAAPTRPAPLPRNFAWAAPAPAIAAAFTGFASVVGEEGAQALDRPTRTLVEERVVAWEGEFPPPTHSWVDEAVTELDREARPGARVALLAALAPYQIDGEVIDDYRAQGADDQQIVAAIAWASFVAASRVAEWLSAPFDDRIVTTR
ncbi:MAG: carboxymuconolactone decarboxylase family protein [Actinomycetota bacterium]